MDEEPEDRGKTRARKQARGVKQTITHTSGQIRKLLSFSNSEGPLLKQKLKAAVLKALEKAKTKTTEVTDYFRKLTAEEKEVQQRKEDARLKVRITELQKNTKQSEIEERAEKRTNARLRKRKSRANQRELSKIFGKPEQRPGKVKPLIHIILTICCIDNVIPSDSTSLEA